MIDNMSAFDLFTFAKCGLSFDRFTSPCAKCY